MTRSRRDRGRREKTGGIDVGRGRRRSGDADIFDYEIERRLHADGIEPAKAVLPYLGSDGEIADDCQFGHDEIGLEARDVSELVGRRALRVGERKLPSLEG